MSVSLPLLLPAVPAQRYSCHGCGNCCRDFTVQLREEDLAKLREQAWETRLGAPVTVEFRGRSYLRQREDGACVFWQDDGRCRIHAEFGLAAKPIACQLFPFSFAPRPEGVQVGLSFACQSVLENRGAALETHSRELRRMLVAVPEASARSAPPLLVGDLRAEPIESTAVERVLDRWLALREVSLAVRLDGFAWLVQMLTAANLQKVRGARFVELVETLASALPGELSLVEIEPPTSGARRMLRQAVYARIEDVKIGDALRRGRSRSVLAQLWNSRRFAAGRGEIRWRLGGHGGGWPERVAFADVQRVRPASDPEQLAAIDDLLSRWLRTTILGGRAWGSGHYGWSIVDGLGATLVNLLATLWLARAHAAGLRHPALTVDDVRAALGRVDRHAGRAPWLGSAGERLRQTYFQTVDAWRGLLREMVGERSAPE